jgi:hypothetical protein
VKARQCLVNSLRITLVAAVIALAAIDSISGIPTHGANALSDDVDSFIEAVARGIIKLH